MDNIANCIKEKGNWGSKLEPELRIDNENFSPELVKNLLPIASPKLDKLITQIKELDHEDLKKHGRMYKHFIYSDIKSGYGAKLIASALKSNGFHHAYGLKQTNRGMSFSLDLKSKYNFNTFAILTSVAFYSKPIGVNFRRELLKKFNERPDNVYGENIRIIVLDSGFREGIDLFDIKYVHLFEPIATLNDQKQAIGRATRFCGQKGLNFDPIIGWPLHVYRYETILTEEVKTYIERKIPDIKPVNTFFDIFMKYSNIDPKKIAFANELEKVVIDSAIDKIYTKNIHDFKIGGKEKYKWPPVQIENLCIDTSKPEQQKGPTIVDFSPTQEFIREYFTPKNPQKGMLLFHSVGTGKTCSAIATATSSFEQENYTIIYVTRYTLKPDVWKNMFDQVCSVVVQSYLKSGKSLPEAQAAKIRLISKKWIEPLSYRQFSNMLDGKNKLYETLIQQNGTKDPLHKTLLIIDEAHKLFAEDVEGQEKADIDVIKKSLNHSYETSGNDSVKVLLMTATPYTSDAMDMIRLVNLLLKSKLPEDFEEFAKQYLDDKGIFTTNGLLQFNKQMNGVVSYLNRERDIRSFAYPTISEIQVPLSDYEFKNEMTEYIYFKNITKGRADDYQYQVVNNKIKVIDLEKTLKKTFNDIVSKKENVYNKCINDNKISFEKEHQMLKNKHKKDMNDCKKILKECQTEIKDKYKKIIKDLKIELKKALKSAKDNKDEKLIKNKYKSQIMNIELDMDFDLQHCNSKENIIKCEARIKRIYEKYKKSIKTTKIKDILECKTLKDDLIHYKNNQPDANKRVVKVYENSLKENIIMHEKRLKALQKDLDEKNINLLQHIQKDKSQRTGIERCLQNKLQPAYKEILNNNGTFDEITSNEEEKPDSGLSDKIYLILGHGSEKITGFKKRQVMPKDKVLIVFPECARPNFLSTICEFMDVYNSPKYRIYLRNPIKYRKELIKLLNRNIRIYLPGDYIPDISTNLFLNFDKEKTVIVKSGVFQDIPQIDRNIFTKPPKMLNLGSDRCLEYSGVIPSPLDYNTNIHREVFKGNIYKPAAQGKSYNELKEHDFKLKDIMENIGTGIYYFTGCRSNYNIDANYEGILEQSDIQQKESKRSLKMGSLADKIRGFKKGSIITPEGSIIVTPENTTIKLEDEKPQEQNQQKKRQVNKKPTPEQKEQLLNLQTEIDDFKISILNDSSFIGNLNTIQEKQINEWKAILDDLPNIPFKNNLIKTLNLLMVILTTKEPPVKLSVELSSDKTYYRFYIGYIFKYNIKSYTYYNDLYGVIPTNKMYLKDKCSSKGLVKRIQTLYEREKLVDLPKEIEKWNDTLFNSICKKTREMLLN